MTIKHEHVHLPKPDGDDPYPLLRAIQGARETGSAKTHIEILVEYEAAQKAARDKQQTARRAERALARSKDVGDLV